MDKRLGLIVCADDFGMSLEINSAIVKLLENRKISAVSCLVTGSAWEEGSILLKEFDNIDTGLHLSFPRLSFSQILKSAYLRVINKDEILKEFKNQLQCFCEKIGKYPDFIDGHEHIHQLPVFRSALLDIVNMIGADKIYIRNSSMSIIDIFSRRTSILKSILISIPGRSFKKCLVKSGIRTNNDLLGVYYFNKSNKPEIIFKFLLKTVRKPNSIFIVHPGRDNIGINRGEETEYLNSDEHKDALEGPGLYLNRFESLI